MPNYLIGDVQGCDAALQRLLHEIDFSPSRDTLYLLGDLVNRGPASLAVLRRLRALEGAAHCLLGNHDLHLLAVAHGVRRASRHDSFGDVLQASDALALLHWLRQRPLALQVQGWLLVHAGVLPQWTAAQTLALAAEVAQQLAGPEFGHFLQHMYGDQPERWSEGLQGTERWRVVVNALTRLRFCRADGSMEFASKDSSAAAPDGYLPWFEVPDRLTAGTPIAFGHWSTLGPLKRPDLLALDTGCVWGGCLSAARLPAAASTHTPQIIKVQCPQEQKPGR